MSRVYPQTPPSSSSPSSAYVSLNPEVFTIWMKSLVFNTHHGCTVYNSKGEIVYRVDNYDSKCDQEVYLMDIRGKVLYSLRQKKLRLFACWDGYKWGDCSLEKRPSFHVKKNKCVCVNPYDHNPRGFAYKIIRMDQKLGFKIVDEDQESTLVAEIKQKQTITGINFGDDVFTLTIQPHVDHSLIMAIVIVYGLMTNQI